VETAAARDALAATVRHDDGRRAELRARRRPEGPSVDAVRAAGKAGELPCLLLIDGPLIPRVSPLGSFHPIDPFVPSVRP
jgi:hypothetical protein